MQAQGKQTPVCQFCGARLIFRGQTSCQACGRTQSIQAAPNVAPDVASVAAPTDAAAEPTAVSFTHVVAPAVPAIADAAATLRDAVAALRETAATPAAVAGADAVSAAASPSAASPSAAAPSQEPAPATQPVRLFESSRMPSPTPLPATVSLTEALAPVATQAPSARIVTPADAPSGNAGAAPPSTIAPIAGEPAARSHAPTALTAHAAAAQPRSGARSGGQPRRPAPPAGAWAPTQNPGPAPATPPGFADPHTLPGVQPAPWWGQTPPPGQYRGYQRRSGSSTNWAVWLGLGIVAIAIFGIFSNAGSNGNVTYYPEPTFDFNQPIAVQTPAQPVTPAQPFAPAVFPSTDPLVPVGSLNEARTEHTATLLPDGRVVVIGGLATPNVPSSALTSIETYDPKTSSFTKTGDLVTARYDETATSISGGVILIAGGRDRDGNPLTSAELYDTNGVTVVTGAMSTPRASASAVLLDDGRVLVVGGDSTDTPSGAEIYDPKTGLFSKTDSQVNGRVTAIRLANSRVLIAGGQDTIGPVRDLITFDPTDDSFENIGPMSNPRDGATSCLLPNGRVFIAGGLYVDRLVNSTAEIYDGTTVSPGSAYPLSTPIALLDGRADNTTTALPDGSVLLVGGQDNEGNPIATIERYDPVANASTPIGTMATGRMGHTATLLADGSVLIVGGQVDGSTTTADASLYWPSGAPKASSSASPSESVLPSGSPVGSPATSQGASPGASSSGSPQPSGSPSAS